LKEIILNQSEEINKIKTNIINEIMSKSERNFSVLSNLIDSIEQNKSHKVSYAEVITEGTIINRSISTFSPQHVVVVRPTDKTKPSEETKQLIKNKVNVNKNKIGVNRITNIRDGGVAIECRSEEDCKKLINEVSAKVKGVAADRPKKISPKLVIKGVSHDVKESELINIIINNNEIINNFVTGMTPEELESHISLKFKFRRNSNRLEDMYCIAVSRELRSKIFNNQKRLFIGWNACYFEDYLPIIRCFKCSGFGHMQDRCTQTEFSCVHCGENHKTLECKQKDKTKNFCVNCDRINSKKNQKQKYLTNHSSFSTECKCFAEIKGKVLSKINV